MQNPSTHSQPGHEAQSFVLCCSLASKHFGRLVQETKANERKMGCSRNGMYSRSKPRPKHSAKTNPKSPTRSCFLEDSSTRGPIEPGTSQSQVLRDVVR